MIADVVRDHIASERANYPVNSNRASELGHPCLRYLVHLRRDWGSRPLPGIGLAEIFREGRDQEVAVRRLLEDAGFVVMRSQQAFSWPNLQITGHIDGALGCRPGEPDWWPAKDAAVPCEIKTCSPWIFSGLSAIEDMVSAKQPWLRKWPDQMQVYLLLSNSPVGVFILKDKTAARIKDLWIHLDWDRASELVKRAEEVNAHLARGTYPDRDEGPHCRSCDFMPLCQPEITNPNGAAILSDPEIEGLLRRRDELMSYVIEAREVDKALADRLPEGIERAVVGDWLVTGKWVERKEYTVPASQYWRRDYAPLAVAQEDL